MSLLVDPDYAIHALRLAYLRRIDDHAGPRVITLPSISHLNVRSGSSSGRDADSGLVDSFVDVVEEDTRSSSPSGGRAAMGGAMSSSSGLSPLPTNSHVFIAGLNDARYQPELTTLYSPKLNNFLAPRQDSRVDLFGGMTGSSRPGAQHDSGAGRGSQPAGLNYTTTILGPGRSGALGMRVSGRRAMSGDVPRRGNGATMSDSVVAEEDMERPLDRQIEGEHKRVATITSAPSNEVHIPHASEQPEGRSQRTSSLRMATEEARLPSSATSAASYRNRSSSQPHHVAPSDALQSDDGTYDDESVFSDESQSASRSASNIYPGPPRSIVTPPSRPPRRVHRSEEAHELISQPRVHQNDGSRSDVLSTTMATNVGSPVMPFRRRSASEGAAEFLRDDVRQQKSADVSRMEPGEDAQLRSEATLFNRLNSNSTLFSLASPSMNQGPSLADRWPRSEGGSAQSLAKLSPASGRIVPRPGDSITSARSRTDDPSPYLRKAMLSASMENSSGMENESAHPSDGSSAPLNNSGDMSSSVRDQELLRPSSAGQLISPGDIIDESLDESAAASSTSLAAPIISALGLQMAWSDKEPLAQPLEPKEPTGNIEGSKSATSEGPALQQHAGLDAHQKQQWFSSLRTDAQTVAKRFESRPQKSGISAMLSKHSQGPSNPFASLYKGVAGGSVSGGSNISIEVYFPFASHYQSEHGAQVPHAKNKSMSLSVRKTATMEEVIGYSLYCYVEEGCHPLLDEDLSQNANEEEREVRLSTLGWTLRIVEDGEVDDDYPAIDRSLTVGNFGADELAVCEATAAQVKQHQSAAHFTRRKVSQPKQAVQTYQSTHGTQSTAVLDPSLSSTLHAVAPTGPSARLAATAGNIPAGSLVHFGGTPIFASSALSKSVMSPSTTSIFLRVLITPNSEVKYKTTLQVPSDMYLADVLETICRKRQLANVDQWALVVPEKDVVVPLDRTVESLQGNHDLALVKRQELGDQAGAGALTGQSTNPNASIFKRLSEPVQVSRYNAAKEIASTYKSYTVNRKQASFLGRHERILTIDGDWLHIIPTDARAFQTQSGTSSFPITAILSCTQSRLPSSFKLIVARESDQKRYEFEAESSKVSAEIVEEINSLMKRTK